MTECRLRKVWIKTYTRVIGRLYFIWKRAVLYTLELFKIVWQQTLAYSSRFFLNIDWVREPLIEWLRLSNLPLLIRKKKHPVAQKQDRYIKLKKRNSSRIMPFYNNNIFSFFHASYQKSVMQLLLGMYVHFLNHVWFILSVSHLTPESNKHMQTSEHSKCFAIDQFL